MFEKFRSYLGEEVDNAPLVLFRIFFGFLVTAESWGAIATGWVKRAFVTADYTFPFIFVDWLKPLPGDGMYYYFILMGCFGLLIMLGWYYRFASFMFLGMWTAVYLMQKTHYNNHYYLMVWVSLALLLFPAHKDYSLDARFGRISRSYHCKRVYILFFVAQVVLVYFVAGLNKLYPDWLEARPISIWFNAKSDYPIIGDLLAESWFQHAIAYGGVIYDTSIGFLLLHPRTRKLAVWLSVVFNLFNSVVFQIGIFPYMMLAFNVFFFPGANLRTHLLRSPMDLQVKPGKMKNVWVWFFAGYFALQIYLPLRHLRYTGDVHWTEEGHRLAWQMMLRTKSGNSRFRIVDKSTGETSYVNPRKFVTSKQANKVAAYPDFTWQFAQYLKAHYAEQGQDVSVYAEVRVSLNHSPYFAIIDPNTDLTAVPWEYFKHSEWIISP